MLQGSTNKFKPLSFQVVLIISGLLHEIGFRLCKIYIFGRDVKNFDFIHHCCSIQCIVGCPFGVLDEESDLVGHWG